MLFLVVNHFITIVIHQVRFISISRIGQKDIHSILIQTNCKCLPIEIYDCAKISIDVSPVFTAFAYNNPCSFLERKLRIIGRWHYNFMNVLFGGKFAMLQRNGISTIPFPNDIHCIESRDGSRKFFKFASVDHSNFLI